MPILQSPPHADVATVEIRCDGALLAWTTELLSVETSRWDDGAGRRRSASARRRGTTGPAHRCRPRRSAPPSRSPLVTTMTSIRRWRESCSRIA